LALSPLIILGIIPKLSLLPFWQLIVITVISGAVAMLMIVRNFTWILAGAALSSSSLIFFWLYLRVIFKNRVSFFKIEFAVPIILAIVVAGLNIFLVEFLKDIFKSRIGY